MADDVTQMLDSARKSLAKELDFLDECSQKAMDELNAAGEYDIKLGSHIAWVARQRAEITGQLRQLEKHDRVMAKSPEQRFKLICAWVETEATPEQRARVAEIIAGIDSARVVA